MGLQWWEAEGQAHGCSDGDGVNVATRKHKEPGQEQQTGPALLSCSSRNLSSSHPLPGTWAFVVC